MSDEYDYEVTIVKPGFPLVPCPGCESLDTYFNNSNREGDVAWLGCVRCHCSFTVARSIKLKGVSEGFSFAENRGCCDEGGT